MKLLPSIVFGVALLAVTPAHADMFCVQQQLANLQYDPGPIDGAFGGKTSAAAVAFAADFGIGLPALDKTNSEPWCEALKEAAASPEGMARRFDVTSVPEGVMSAAATEKLWDMYKNIDECLEFDAVPGGGGYDIPLARLAADAVAATQWRSPYTEAISAPVCSALAPSFAQPPAPVPVVRLDEAYGERQAEVDTSMEWFQRASTFVRMTGDPVARLVLKNALLDWAANDSLGQGIRVSWGNRPVDYQMLAAIMGLFAATAEVIPDLTEADKATLGPWLNKLANAAATSHWRDRTDNKQLMRSYIVLLWGIIVDDSRAVQEGIDAYKLAIHDMRPDGSFPVDSQRGAMGIQYNSYNVSYLVQIGAAVKEAYGLDLYAYEVDGRSIHQAVDFMVRSIKTPGETNAIYAISCPESGDRFGTISEPSLGFLDDSTMLLVYADAFPDSENAAWIRANIAVPDRMMLSEHAGGAAACQFAPATNVAFSGESIKIEGVYALPEPKYPLFPTEELAHKVGMDPQVNSLMFSEINIPPDQRAEIGIQKINFNIVGKFDFLGKTFGLLTFVFGQNLPEASVEPIKACFPDFDVTTWDDGTHHLVVRLKKNGQEFLAPDLACVRPHLPEEVANMADFITNNFRDFAIGMVRNNSLPAVKHDGLRAWLEAVAIGEEAFLRPPGYEPAS